MEEMVAYCGIVCTECPAYIATQNDDMGALKLTAEDPLCQARKEEFEA